MKNVGFLILLVGLVVASCKSTNDVNPNTAEVGLHFFHYVDGVPVQLDQLIYKNALDQQFSIKTIKYFISGVKLYKEDNTTVELSDIHYVDARTPETLSHIYSEKILPGNYTGLSFVYGLIPSENITGMFPDPPESLMEWPVPMGGGYHYMKLEGEYKTATEESFFNFHSGMLNGTAYEIHVDLQNQPFEVVGSDVNIVLNMEIQKWFTNSTDWDFPYWGGGIMGNPDAQKTVQENGVDVFNFLVVEKTQ
jgi:hypothetical protein